MKNHKKYKCLCCRYWTLDTRGEFEICPVCFWEDEPYILFDKCDENGHILSVFYDNDCEKEEYNGQDVLDRKSRANHGLTLRQGRENYKAIGACTPEMKKYCREPEKSEMLNL